MNIEAEFHEFYKCVTDEMPPYWMSRYQREDFWRTVFIEALKGGRSWDYQVCYDIAQVWIYARNITLTDPIGTEGP